MAFVIRGRGVKELAMTMVMVNGFGSLHSILGRVIIAF